MASSGAASNYANVTRELRILEHMVTYTPPDFEELRDDALLKGRDELSQQITATKAEIKRLRDAYPVARWVDADPVYRDAHSPWTNNH